MSQGHFSIQQQSHQVQLPYIIVDILSVGKLRSSMVTKIDRIYLLALFGSSRNETIFGHGQHGTMNARTDESHQIGHFLGEQYVT